MTWPVTDAFKTALRKSHTPTMKVEILENGIKKAGTDVLAVGERIDVTTGGVNDDRKTLVGRRTASWTVIDKHGAFAPLALDDPTYPLRDLDVRLWRGIGAELVPLATVQLERSRVKLDEAASTWEMSGTDRSSFIGLADWRSEFTVAAGTTPYTATQNVLARVDPGHTYTITASPTTKTLDEMTFIPGEDPNPWEAIRKFWEAAAMEVFIDQMGQIKAQPYPNPLTAPIAWEFLDDDSSIRVAPLTVDIDRRTLRNGVVVRGNAPWLLYGVYGEAWDTDPGSSTYYDPANAAASKVGPHPEYIEDPLVGSAAEAAALAAAKLPDILGIEEAVEIAAIPNPSLEAGDVILVKNKLISPASRFIFDQLETPLTLEGTQTGSTRRRTR